MSIFIKTRPNKTGTADTPRPRRGWARWLHALSEFLPEAALLAVAIVLWTRTGTFRATPPGELGPDFWPKTLIVLLVVCALVRVGQKVRYRLGDRENVAPAAPPVVSSQKATETDAGVEANSAQGTEEEHETDTKKLAIAIALAIGYVLGAVYMGYLIATAVFVVAFLYLAGRRNLLINSTIGVGAAVAFSYVFLKVVYVSVPSGIGVFDSFTVWIYGLIGIY